jgi:hypothetical protein
VSARRLVLVVALAAGCGGGTADHGTVTCTQIGCISGLFVTARDVPLGLQQIQASTLAVCRNGTCLASSLAAWDGTMPFVFRDPAQTASVEVKIFDEAGGARFEIAYSPGVEGPLPDGDLYDVTLTAADGTRPIDLEHHAVTYSRNQPNGPSCAPVCYDAVVQL